RNVEAVPGSFPGSPQRVPPAEIRAVVPGAVVAEVAGTSERGRRQRLGRGHRHFVHVRAHEAHVELTEPTDVEAVVHVEIVTLLRECALVLERLVVEAL